MTNSKDKVGMKRWFYFRCIVLSFSFLGVNYKFSPQGLNRIVFGLSLVLTVLLNDFVSFFPYVKKIA